MSIIRNYRSGDTFVIEFEKSAKPEFVFQKSYQYCLTNNMYLGHLNKDDLARYGDEPCITVILFPIPETLNNFRIN